MNPPDDVTPSELWLKLQEMPAPSQIVDFPRKDKTGKEWIGKVRIMVLDIDQINRCQIRALETFRNSPRVEKGDEEGSVGKGIVSDIITREVLAEACHEAQPWREKDGVPMYKKLFMTAQKVGILHRDELVALWASYIMVQEKFGPHDSNMSIKEVNAWIKTLVEGGSAFPLARLGSAQQADLTQWLALRVWSLSANLSHHLPNLPPSLVRAYEEWGCATFSSGEPLDDSLKSGTNDRDDVTIEEAMEAARALLGKLVGAG